MKEVYDYIKFGIGNPSIKLIPSVAIGYWSHEKQMERQAKKIREDYKRYIAITKTENYQTSPEGIGD